MSDKTTPTCGTCRYFFSDLCSAHSGWCGVDPPAVVVLNGHPQSLRPMTKDDAMGCARWVWKVEEDEVE